MFGSHKLKGRHGNALPATATLSLVSIATSSSANTKNAFSTGQLFASLPFDTTMLEVVVYGFATTGGSNLKSVFDIGIGASGSETAIIENVPCGHCSLFADNTNLGTPRTYYFPVFIPAGTRVAFRHQCTTGSQNAKVAAWAHAAPLSYAGNAYRRAETYGIALASTGGEAVAASGSGGGTWSPWIDVGSTTSKDYYGVMPSVVGHADTTMANGNFVFHVGYGDGAVVLGEWWGAWSALEISSMWPNLPVRCFVPSGTQLQARCRGAGNSENTQYGITCFY